MQLVSRVTSGIINPLQLRTSSLTPQEAGLLQHVNRAGNLAESSLELNTQIIDRLLDRCYVLLEAYKGGRFADYFQERIGEIENIIREGFRTPLLEEGVYA